MILRIATRRSNLALAQSHWIKAQLEALESGLSVELHEYVTRGDRIQNVPLAEVGGKGLFTKEIEDALLAGEADIAVHSLKDLPAELPAGLTLAAVPIREDPRDVLVLPRREGDSGEGECSATLVRSLAQGRLDGIAEGARVGSSSSRRSAQLLHLRPDLRVDSVRGNVDTRLRKLDEGQYDALVLAAAGLNRLGLAHRISAHLPEELSTPSPGQGALGLEARADDESTRALLARLEDRDTRRCVSAERALMDALGGGCSVPLGASALFQDGELRLIAVVAEPEGLRLLRRSGTGSPDDPAALGRAVAQMLVEAGARELLEALKA